MHQLDEGGDGERPKSRRVEHEAGSLALPVPFFAVCVEDAVPEEVAEVVQKRVSLGEVVEVGLEQVLHVERVRRQNRLEVGAPRTPESESAASPDQDLGGPLIHVLLHAGDERREHPDERPGREAMPPLLAKGAEYYEEGCCQEQLKCLDFNSRQVCSPENVVLGGDGSGGDVA